MYNTSVIGQGSQGVILVGIMTVNKWQRIVAYTQNMLTFYMQSIKHNGTWSEGLYHIEQTNDLTKHRIQLVK